jgi:preprotein translocase subunit SecG
MLFAILVFFFIIVCIFLVFLILIQSDKGGGISGAIGGSLGGASNLLGTQDTANILTKGTAIFGGVFLLLCVLMSLVLNQQNNSVKASILQEKMTKEKKYAPARALDNVAGEEELQFDNPDAIEKSAVPADSK